MIPIRSAQIRSLHDEQGTEFIQFIFTLPLLLIVTLLCWQIYLIAQTISVAIHVTQGAARHYSLCGAMQSDAEWWAHQIAPPGIQPLSVEAHDEGDEAIVNTTFSVRTIAIPYILKQQLPDLPMRAVMRREECRRGDAWEP